jgi:hypothetical protein
MRCAPEASRVVAIQRRIGVSPPFCFGRERCGRIYRISKGLFYNADPTFRKIIFEITISNFDFTKGPIRGPVVRWNPDKDEVTVDGRHCRLLTDEEAD